MKLKNHLKILTPLVGLLFTSPLIAEEKWHKVDFTVKQIVLEGSDDQPLVSIDLDPNPQTECADNSFVQLVNSSTEKGRQGYSLLMTAAASKKKVRLYLQDCTDSNGRTRPRVIHLLLSE